ncbi:MAG: MFS transporter, partial [Chloroflexota bacterium]
QTGFWSGLRQLLTNRRWLIFLAAALVQGMSLSIFLNYLFLHLEGMGVSRIIMGYTLTISTVSEIPIFIFSKKLLRRGAPLLLAASLFFAVIRAFAYAGMTEGWHVLLISLLHGPTFAAMWAAGVAYADEAAGPGLSATAQGVFGGTVMGLGTALGALVGGFLYEQSGAIAAFRWAGWTSLAALIFFLFAHRHGVVDLLQAAKAPSIR